MDNWIYTKDKLPEERPGWSHSKDVNILYSDSEVSTGSYRYLNIREWADYIYGKREGVEVIAWQPLPRPHKPSHNG